MLKRVSIQNFKSLKDVTLDLQKVNLLIGPNNSGKTNFLKALEFFVSVREYKTKIMSDEYSQEVAEKMLEYAKSQKYRFVRSIFKQEIKREIVFNLVLEGEEEDKRFEVKWSQEERKITRDRFDRNIIFSWRLQELLNYPLIYKPDPSKLDKPGPVGRGDSIVAADASNLIAFFDRIRDEYPGTFAQIKADLAKCVPEFTEINFQNVESTEELVKQFGDKTFKRIGLTNEGQKTIYWADELSEGTLYFIALLCIINQPNPPKLLLLEEPEKGIHPRRIFEVIQFIFRLAEEKDVQIIMTTHSPIVVDMFKDMPESVFIFDKDEEGATHVKNLQKDVIEPEIVKSNELGIEPPHYTDSLGDAWTVGFLGGVPK